MFNISSQITLKVKFLRNEEQRCLLPSLVDDFTCVHSKNALLTHILSTLFSSTSVLFSCAPFGTKSIVSALDSSSPMATVCHCIFIVSAHGISSVLDTASHCIFIVSAHGSWTVSHCIFKVSLLSTPACSLSADPRSWSHQLLACSYQHCSRHNTPLLSCC